MPDVSSSKRAIASNRKLLSSDVEIEKVENGFIVRWSYETKSHDYQTKRWIAGTLAEAQKLQAKALKHKVG